jgi:hypothetical protein
MVAKTTSISRALEVGDINDDWVLFNRFKYK